MTFTKKGKGSTKKQSLTVLLSSTNLISTIANYSLSNFPFILGMCYILC